MIGLHRPGHSILHRLAAGWKLAALVAFGVVSVLLLRAWWMVLAVNLIIALLYAAAGFTPRLWWAQVRPMALLVGFTALFHLWISGWERAVAVSGLILALVAAAALVTLTTPTQRLMDVVVRLMTPLRPLGVDPDRVGLFLIVGLRAVPLVAELARGVREAQIARRATGSVQAFTVPLIVRSLREADALAEALVARGIDD